MTFSGYPRGPRVAFETGCRSTQRLTSQLRLALEPERFENPTATAKEKSQDGADSIETLKLFVVSDVGRRSTLLSSRRSVQSWQFFWLRSGAPFLVSCLWPAKLHRTLGADRVCSQQSLPLP